MAEEYTDYQLPLTAEEIRIALKLMHNIEYGCLNISVPSGVIGKTGTFTIRFSKSHSAPQPFLQIRRDARTSPTEFTVQPIVTDVSTTQCEYILVATNTSDNQNIKTVPSGNYKIQYFVVG
ncbi:MAG: hypothetical protein Q4D35_03015 [Ruminococcus sp.]|nr:hypothetical protein [Ruminococcus sp.]